MSAALDHHGVTSSFEPGDDLRRRLGLDRHGPVPLDSPAGRVESGLRVQPVIDHPAHHL